MWFKRKPGNRRLGRADVLDVRLRARPLRAARWRMAALVAVLGLGLSLTGYLGVWGMNWLRREIIDDNQAFALNTIEVHTDGWITPEQVRQWAGVKLGDNLLALDLGRIHSDLTLVPQIEAVSVERILPHQLVLRVTEREPVARVQGLVPGPQGEVRPAVYYLDAAAVVIPPLPDPRPASPLAQGLESLPVFKGISGLELRAGQAMRPPAVHAALDFLASFERSPMAGLVDIKGIDVSAPEVLLVTTGQGAEVTFGLERPELQLQRWHAVYEVGLKLDKAVATLDLSVTNNCPVTWQALGVPPAPRPKPLKPLLRRKKNV